METDTQKTSMANVWTIVLGMMLLTAALLYGWHVVMMGSIMRDHRITTATLRAELVDLSAYADSLTVSASSSSRSDKVNLHTP